MARLLSLSSSSDGVCIQQELNSFDTIFIFFRHLSTIFVFLWGIPLTRDNANMIVVDNQTIYTHRRNKMARQVVVDDNPLSAT